MGLVMLNWGRVLSVLGTPNLGINLLEFRALWAILLGFRINFDFVKSLN
jgi:hypothetical protein